MSSATSTQAVATKSEVIPHEGKLPVDYFDGIQEVTLANGVAKMSLYRTVSFDGVLEKRQLETTIAVPAVALLEFCRSFLGFAAQDGVADGMANEIRTKFKAATQGVSPNPSAPSTAVG